MSHKHPPDSGLRPTSRLQNLAGIHQSLRVEDLLDAAHQFELQRVFVCADGFTLELPQAVLGADAAVEFAHHLINQPVHRALLLRDEEFVLCGIRQRDVVVDVAVAHVSERDDTHARICGVHGGIGARDEFRHALTGTEMSCLMLMPSRFCASLMLLRSFHQFSAASASVVTSNSKMPAPKPCIALRSASSSGRCSTSLA